MKKVVVTGGKGFIGKHLVSALKEKGTEVVVVDTPEFDITTPDTLTGAFAGAEVVFHLAALPRVQYSIENPHKSHETNITGTLNVLLAAKDAGVKRVVFSSSSAVYGNSTTLPLTESATPHPISPYALHKFVGEQYCRLFSDVYGLSTVSLRYFNAYGPGADPNGAYALVIAKFLQQRIEGKPMTITGDGTQTRDFTHVRDIVQANIVAAESTKVGKGDVLNIGAGSGVSVNAIAHMIGGPTEYIAARLEPHDTFADTTLAKQLLNWSPTVRVEDGIAELKKLNGLL